MQIFGTAMRRLVANLGYETCFRMMIWESSGARYSPPPTGRGF